MISVLDYGVGNIGSIANMFRYLSIKFSIINTPEEVEQAEKLILPGVGAFDHAMERLEESNLMDALNKLALQDKKPVLGICLGMQLLLEKSEEGKKPGLGWIKGEVLKFDSSLGIKVPHMGWNQVAQKVDHPLWQGIEDQARFYFVHSYYVAANHDFVMGQTHYGVDLAAAIGLLVDC